MLTKSRGRCLVQPRSSVLAVVRLDGWHPQNSGDEGCSGVERTRCAAVTGSFGSRLDEYAQGAAEVIEPAIASDVANQVVVCPHLLVKTLVAEVKFGNEVTE